MARPPRLPLATDRIPTLPPGISRLLQILQNDELPFTEAADVIEKSPNIAAKLLSLANSAWSAPISPVMSIEAACSRLGLRMVRTVSIALAISHPFNPARCPAFEPTRFWTSALLTADAATWLGEHFGHEDVAVTRTAGLLSNLGLLWLAVALPAETAAALAAAVPDRRSGTINTLLSERCGIGYDEAGSRLTSAWHFPALISEAIGRQTLVNSEASVLDRSVAAAVRLVRYNCHEIEISAVDPALSQLGVEHPIQIQLLNRLRFSRKRTEELATTLFGS